MLIIVICWLMKMKYSNLKLTIKMLTIQLNFVWEVCLNGNVHDYSIDNNYMDQSDILTIHKYLIRIKQNNVQP